MNAAMYITACPYVTKGHTSVSIYIQYDMYMEFISISWTYEYKQDLSDH